MHIFNFLNKIIYKPTFHAKTVFMFALVLMFYYRVTAFQNSISQAIVYPVSCFIRVTKMGYCVATSGYDSPCLDQVTRYSKHIPFNVFIDPNKGEKSHYDSPRTRYERDDSVQCRASTTRPRPPCRRPPRCAQLTPIKGDKCRVLECRTRVLVSSKKFLGDL